ncbi:MAG TPA: class I SAM-dependent methyltransferase, partial [Bacteroidetes bacterium]|nr:class I SAM-dependent methyltransferase [Bacteroidota bacterium]
MGSIEDRLRRALRAAVDERNEASPAAWTGRIEARRTELLARREVIEVIDHGAGSRGNGRGVAASPKRYRAGVAELVRSKSTYPVWGRFLYHLVRELRPDVCLEFGSGFGISTAYLGAGLRENGSGTLASVEGASSIAALARETVTALDLSGVVQVVEDRFANAIEALPPSTPAPGFIFLDGHHD